jgi:hypothetical protein
MNIKMYRTVILPVVLYGCEMLSLTLREEHRLRVFQNRVLSKTFGPKGEEVTANWRKLREEELLTKYYSGDKPRNSEIGGACSTYRGGEVYTGFWSGNVRGRRHLEGLGVYNIVKMNLQEMGTGDLDWIDLAQDRDTLRGLGNAVLNHRIP